MFMKQTADRLFGDDYIWSVLAAGRFQMPFVTQAAMMGGHVRVGLEDSIYLEKGVLAKSNADQVKKIRKIPIARPKSPILFTMNALIAASFAVSFLYQKPIRR